MDCGNRKTTVCYPYIVYTFGLTDMNWAGIGSCFVLRINRPSAAETHLVPRGGPAGLHVHGPRGKRHGGERVGSDAAQAERPQHDVLLPGVEQQRHGRRLQSRPPQHEL